MNPECKAAYEAQRMALRAFEAVRAAYLAKQVDDGTFLAARDALDAAVKTYDLVLAKELFMRRYQ